MTDPNRELTLEELPRPPLHRLTDEGGRDVYAGTAVGGETATVGVLFSDAGLAREFAAHTLGHGMEVFAGLEPRTLESWDAVEAFAAGGEDYVLVVARGGSGLFHAGDVARKVAEKKEEVPFPLYLISDQRGESPLITVETGQGEAGEVLVAALFTSPESARAFKQRAAHLDLPDALGTIDDAEGLRRHALVAQQAGADYAVVDPEVGETAAIPIEELVR